MRDRGLRLLNALFCYGECRRTDEGQEWAACRKSDMPLVKKMGSSEVT